MKRELHIEPIENGFLIIVAKEKPEGWVPDDEREEPQKIAGIVIEPTVTWYAKDMVEALKLIKEKYFDLLSL